MSIKFTTTDVENAGPPKLLFEFLDIEVPENIEIEIKAALGKSEFIGSLQTNQINGVYLQPVNLKGIFHGNYVRKKKNGGEEIINGHERSMELGRIVGRPVKFYYDLISFYVIIENYKRKYNNMSDIEYEFTLVPHDFQKAVEPVGFLALKEQTIPLVDTDVSLKIGTGTNTTEDYINVIQELYQAPQNPSPGKTLPPIPGVDLTNPGNYFNELISSATQTAENVNVPNTSMNYVEIGKEAYKAKTSREGDWTTFKGTSNFKKVLDGVNIIEGAGILNK
jgi:hypothetical protein